MRFILFHYFIFIFHYLPKKVNHTISFNNIGNLYATQRSTCLGTVHTVPHQFLKHFVSLCYPVQCEHSLNEIEFILDVTLEHQF